MFSTLQVSRSFPLWLKFSFWLVRTVLILFSRADECATVIRLGCTDFPQNRRDRFSTIPVHQGSVELLEIDGNTTLSGGPEQGNSSSSGGLSTAYTSPRTFANVSNGIAMAPWPT